MNNKQKISITIVISFILFLLVAISKYWYADYLYNMGKNYNSIGKPDIAVGFLTNAIKNSPKQALYHNEIAVSYALLSKADKKFADKAAVEIKTAIENSPNNTTIIRAAFGVYARLSETDRKYLIEAKKMLDTAILRSPNDPKLFYNLGLLYAQVGQNEEAKKMLAKAIELKPDYESPKEALKLISEDDSEEKKP